MTGDSKTCAKCQETKALDDFHRQPSGPKGRHSYCKPCANKLARESKMRNYTPEQKRRWHMKARYGVSASEVDAMVSTQEGKCPLCDRPLEGKRPCVDHDHNTGRVRGVLCHRCNIRLGGWDDLEWRKRALEYLKINDKKGTHE